MILNKDSAQKIDTLYWHGIIDADTGVIENERYRLANLVLSLHRNPQLKNGQELISVPYALSAKRGDDLILVVSIEQEDLRAMARNLGCSLRELQQENNTKGTLGPAHLVAYCEAEREDLGLYEDKMDETCARITLMDWACDIVDIMEDPVPLA